MTSHRIGRVALVAGILCCDGRRMATAQIYTKVEGDWGDKSRNRKGRKQLKEKGGGMRESAKKNKGGVVDNE